MSMPKSLIRGKFHFLVAALLLLLSFESLAYTQSRVVKGPDGKPVKIEGSVVMIEPEIQLYEAMASGILEPRQEWSKTAQKLYPEMVAASLKQGGVSLKPEFEIRDDLDPNSRIGQIIRLNKAVSFSIRRYTLGNTSLATKKGKQLDWSLGPGVQELQKATGADYALFTMIEDSYSSKGLAALRIIGALWLGGDIGGGAQVGITTLVDLKTGQVVWFNYIYNQTGDLRNEEGAKATAKKLLKGFPL